MGRFLNPDNGAFSEAVNSEIYIDKTRLLEYTNRVINTTSKFICNSRKTNFRTCSFCKCWCNEYRI